MLGGVHAGRPALAVRVGRALPSRLGGTVWFYLACGWRMCTSTCSGGSGWPWPGLGGYAAGLVIALVPFVRTARRRPPRTAASWMLGAGMAWLTFAVVADLATSPRVVDLDGRVGRLVPPLAGFALQTLTGALSYLLPVVFGRNAWGNRRLTDILELAWPPRVAAINLGVLLLVARPASGWLTTAGWWLTGLGLATFVPLAAALAASHLRAERTA